MGDGKKQDYIHTTFCNIMAEKTPKGGQNGLKRHFQKMYKYVRINIPSVGQILRRRETPQLLKEKVQGSGRWRGQTVPYGIRKSGTHFANTSGKKRED